MHMYEKHMQLLVCTCRVRWRPRGIYVVYYATEHQSCGTYRGTRKGLNGRSVRYPRQASLEEKNKKLFTNAKYKLMCIVYWMYKQYA